MFTIYTKANRIIPANEFKIAAENIICNDVMLPREFDEASRFNPHNVRLWIIGHTFGVICAVFASCEQDALDSAVDADMLDCMLVEDQDYEDDTITPLGNAGELFDLSDCWVAEADIQAERDIKLIVKLARAEEAGYSNLDF